MNISKLDAARRQLETAVNLYFHECDPVSIHTLTCAAYEILRRINTGGKPMVKDWMRDYIRPKYVREFGDKLNEAQNFFKHSGKDTDQTLTFNAGQTDILLLDACWTYRRVAQERLPLLAIFEMWAALTWAKSFVTYDGMEQLDQERLAKWAGSSRQEFFDSFLPVAYEATVARPSPA